MFKKLIVSESQKSEILNLHRVLNEEDGTFSIDGTVVDKFDERRIPFAKLLLKQNDETLKNIQADINGKFKFDGLSSGSYTIFISAKNEGYIDKTEKINITNKNIIDLTFKLEKEAKELGEVIVGPEPVTLLSFKFITVDGKTVDDVTIKLKSPFTNDEIVEQKTTTGTLDFGFYRNGDLVEKNIQTLDLNKKSSIFYFKKDDEFCTNQKNVVIEVISKYQTIKKKINFCLKNATYDVMKKALGSDKKNENLQEYTPKEETKLGRVTKDSNMYTITLVESTLSCEFKTIDNNNKIVPNVSLTLWGDKQKTISIGSVKTDNNGLVKTVVDTSKLETLLEDSDDTKVKIYIDSQKEGYKPYDDSFNLKVNKNNEVEIKLTPKKQPRPPKPAKPMSFRECKKEIRNYYKNYITTIKKGKSIEDAGGEEFIIDSKEQVKWCYINYQKRYSQRYEKAIRRLRNTATNYDVFELNFTLDQQRDIYKENRQMRLNNTIRKVIFEQNEKKQSLITETKIIRNRLGYIVENSNKYNLKRNLLKESNKLVNRGYNRDIIKESFIDIMTSMKDPNTFLTDVKNKLGQKIADTVKDKQQEHEMIMGAFGEIDPSVVERAFKENKTDELSDIISKKAIENYKTQFGDGGIMGSMIASVDENKFKTEVSKLLQTAIDQMNSEMGEKMQDTVSDDETE